MMTSRSGNIKLSHRTAISSNDCGPTATPMPRHRISTLEIVYLAFESSGDTILLTEPPRKRWLWAVVVSGLLVAFAMKALIAYRYHPFI